MNFLNRLLASRGEIKVQPRTTDGFTFQDALSQCAIYPIAFYCHKTRKGFLHQDFLFESFNELGGAHLFMERIGEKGFPFNKRKDRLATYQDLFPNRLD
jgi:hypothetical protein